MLNSVDDNRPPSPLVKQLKQKFDRMIENNELSKSYSQSQTGLSKVPRVGHDEIDAAYPLLPVCCFTFFFSNAFSSNLLSEFVILF
jgi:hypothetical protein